MAQTSINSNLASNKPLMNMIGAGNIDSTDGSNINLGNVQLQNGINAVYATGPENDIVKIITGSTIPLATGFKQSLVNMNPANYIDKKTHYFTQTFKVASIGGPESKGETAGGITIPAGTGSYPFGSDLIEGRIFLGLNGIYYNQSTSSLDLPVRIDSSGNMQRGYTTAVLSADKTANDGWSDAGQIVMADGRLPTETNY